MLQYVFKVYHTVILKDKGKFVPHKMSLLRDCSHLGIPIGGGHY